MAEFEGINYAAEVWVNGAKLSTIRGETRTLETDAAASDLDGHEKTIAVDGWNTTAAEAKSGGVMIEPNRDAEPDLKPVRGFAEDGTPARVLRVWTKDPIDLGRLRHHA